VLDEDVEEWTGARVHGADGKLIKRQANPELRGTAVRDDQTSAALPPNRVGENHGVTDGEVEQAVEVPRYRVDELTGRHCAVPKLDRAARSEGFAEDPLERDSMQRRHNETRNLERVG
jgi:hypothetical protein